MFQFLYSIPRVPSIFLNSILSQMKAIAGRAEEMYNPTRKVSVVFFFFLIFVVGKKSVVLVFENDCGDSNKTAIIIGSVIGIICLIAIIVFLILVFGVEKLRARIFPYALQE